MSDEEKVVPMNEAELEEVETAVEESFNPPPEPEQPVLACKADTDAILDAVKELTKIVGELMDENKKWFRAGKM